MGPKQDSAADWTPQGVDTIEERLDECGTALAVGVAISVVELQGQFRDQHALSAITEILMAQVVKRAQK